mgnify:CR=1 FL=1
MEQLGCTTTSERRKGAHLTVDAVIFVDFLLPKLRTSKTRVKA